MKQKIYLILLLSASCALQAVHSYTKSNKSMLDTIFENASDKNKEHKANKHIDPEEDYIAEEEFENISELDNQYIISNEHRDTNDTYKYFVDGEDYQPKAYDIRY